MRSTEALKFNSTYNYSIYICIVCFEIVKQLYEGGSMRVE